MAADRSLPGTFPAPLTAARTGIHDRHCRSFSLEDAPGRVDRWQIEPLETEVLLSNIGGAIATPDRAPWYFFWAAAFLVSGPVFFEAPLVRTMPLLALALSPVWAGIAWWLSRRDRGRDWGNLLSGFFWSWLAGAIYWGWFRQEPALHLPIEAIGIPWVLWALRSSRWRIGACFYLGSLLGTTVTDLYCYAVDLLPDWRAAMMAEPSAIGPVMDGAILKMNAFPGLVWAAILAGALAIIGLVSLRDQSPAGRSFSGAVLNTLLVDGLFWVTAWLA